MNFCEIFEENLRNCPDTVLLADDMNPKGISYRQLDKVSGKVYAYLKAKGVGKEDFVMLLLPRSIQPIEALVGVLKNGSAFVVVEDNYAPERIEFIKKDCNAKIVLNSDVWEEIQTYEPLPGFEPWDEHAAAFAVYTSGTTGNPKGVLHEYGNIDRMIDSVNMRTCAPLTIPEDRFGLVAPLNFVASTLIIFYGLVHHVFLYVVPYSVIKNPMQTGMFIIKNKITGIFLTPSYIRKLKSKPPMLRFCIIGSEPANGVFLDGLTIHNFYLMSESGFAVAHFLIDKKYEYTPVGSSEFGHEILLLDENGKPVPPGEEGEVCFENKYVRGYINLPKETAEAFRAGIYHTNDLGRLDENGRLIICGRLNDMVKINGNRVEPGEIEEVTKKVLNIPWAAAKIFDDGRKVFIAVYYTDNKIQVDFEATRKEMEKYLPYYMLPSYFIHIDEIPLRPSGKMDRKALPKPEAESYKADYVAPRDDIEERICKAFSEVLEIEKVGIHDDFYQLGGDSLGTMDLLVKSNIKGLSSSDVFSGHTPEKIAQLWKEKHPNGEGESEEVLNEQAIKEKHALSPYQRYMVDYQLYTPMSTMFNLFTMVKFDKERFDIAKMAKVVEKVIANHPALLTKLSFNLDGEMQQQYEPDFKPEVQIEKISLGELDSLKDTLVRPFKIMNSRLYRVRLFETPKAGYLFFDVHHVVFDGTSFKVIISDIVKTYYDMEPEPDYYYLTLQEWEDEMNSPKYREAKAYFEEKYDGDFWSGRPQTDFEARENALDHLSAPIAVEAEQIHAAEEKYGISRNEFFCAVTLLSIAVHNHAGDIQISWTYNGRDEIRKMNGIGLLLRDLPLAVRLEKKAMVGDVLQDVKQQIAKGIEYGCYPYTLEESADAKNDRVCFLYQQDIRDGGMDEDMNICMVDVKQNAAAAENVLDVQILDGNAGLAVVLDYDASRYKKETMERFMNIIQATASVLSANLKEDFTVIKAVKEIEKNIGERELFTTWIK